MSWLSGLGANQVTALAQATSHSIAEQVDPAVTAGLGEPAWVRASLLPRCRWQSALMAGAAGCALLVTGCGTARLNVKHDFPSREALESIASEPVKPVPRTATKGVAEWTVAPAEDTASPLDPLLDGAKLTAPLRCVAREVGRFVLESEAFPDERLQRFIKGACGAPQDNVSLWRTLVQLPESADPVSALRPSWSAPDTRGTEAGVWFGRAGARAVAVVAKGGPSNAPTAEAANEQGQVVVRGVAQGAFEQVFALVNQGEVGFTRCERSEPVKLPEYAFTCTLAPSDPYAWVEVGAIQPGRVLFSSLGTVLARRNATQPLALSARRRKPQPARSPEQVASAIVAGVNELRAASSLPTLELVPKQSAQHARLASHFFAATLANDSAKSETIALGLLAGWDVGLPIRDGSLFGALVSGSQDAGSWLDYALDSPLGRQSLLATRVTHLAVGAAPPETWSGFGALVSTYELYRSADHRADVAALAKRINASRSGRGLGVLQLYTSPQLAEQAQRLAAGEDGEMAALEAAMTAERDRTGQSVRGWVMLGTRVEDLKLPEELLSGPPGTVAIEVTHYTPAGMPWGMLIALVLAPAQAAQQTASAGPRAPTARHQ